MKRTICLLFAITLGLLGQHALAGNGSSNKHGINNWKKQDKQYHFQWSNNKPWNSKKGWRSAKNDKFWKDNGKRGGHGGFNGKKAHSVPELDASVAPLAGLLLTGLLAAGVERRRRQKLKTINS